MKNLNAKFIISAEKLSQCPDFNMPEFPLLGRSNVGKSSFINGLANNKKLARTSNVPGKTRLINFFNFSEKFMIADLPGYGYAKVSIEARNKWQKYLELREKAIDIENSIAEEFISPQLLVTLRKNCISDMLELSQMHVCEAVQYEVLRVLVDKPIRTNKMLSVVNFIRNNPESFPEWHASETAKLFAPPIYTNLKTNKGYWF